MRHLIALLLMLLPTLALAQGTATLVADDVAVSGGQRLIASGNVQVFYDGTTLSAAAITYDEPTDSLRIDGPIFIRAADGTILTADSATLDPALRNGILRGARLVLDRQLQLAANRIDRVDGRYTALTRSAVTSCQVCGTGAPLWEIRADRVIHDELERQLYFENATFRIRGIPVLWVPRARLPDPTLTRATGLLIPQFRTTDQLGLGIKLPYFIRIGDSRDLTLTPYLSTETRTLEARYRQAFLAGAIQIDAAISEDTILSTGSRSYLFADGAFDLPRDWRLSFRLETASDPAYLLDYGYSDADRLESGISAVRVRDRDIVIADIAYYDSLRDDEIDASLPPFVADASWERRMTPPVVGGTLTYGLSADTFQRTDGAIGDAGRDMTRLGGSLDWGRQWILPAGVVLEGDLRIELDHFAISDDPDADSGTRAMPTTGVVLRWPLLRRSDTGVTHVIEPVVALAWSDSFGIRPPNEDGTLAEFDEGNLYSLSRLPGHDAREDGTRIAAGIGWTRTGPAGTVAALSFGRLFQDAVQPGFSATSGLSQRTSDWLLAGQLSLPDGFALDARALFDDTFEFDKTEARLDWSGERVGITASYYWLPADPTRNRPEPASEWAIDADVILSDRWTIGADARYDVAADQASRAGIDIGWRNECVTVDLSLSRRYTSSTTVEPTTDLGLSISLTGFSAGRSDGAPEAGCR